LSEVEDKLYFSASTTLSVIKKKHKIMKIDILAIGVHPDDVELSASGTILKHIALGKKVGLLDLTKGELGTRGNAVLRTEEATKAANILGVSVREQLDMADGFLKTTKFTKNKSSKSSENINLKLFYVMLYLTGIQTTDVQQN